MGMHRPGRKEGRKREFIFILIVSTVHKSCPFCVPGMLMSVLVMCTEMSRENFLSESEVYQLFLLMCSICLEFRS